MPTVQLKHSSGEPTLMLPEGAPKCPQWGAPKSKFSEIRQVWCLSLRLDAYCSAETFFWKTYPHGARGTYHETAPLMGPHLTSTEIHLCMVSIDAHSQFTTFFWRADHHGPPGAPKGTQNGASSLGTYSTSVLVWPI